MKKFLITIILFSQIGDSFSQNPAWTIINNTSPVYNFEYPGNPTISDTLNIKHYFYALDTTIGFQVFQIKYAQLDSSNSSFTSALQQTNGDTLRAFVNTLLSPTNSQLINTQDVVASSDYKALEIKLKYNQLNAGRTVVSFVRFYYNKNVLVSFTITGFEYDLANLTSNKNLFFNSIFFPTTIQ